MKYKAIFFDVDGVLIDSPRLFTEQLTLDYGIAVEKTLPFFTERFRLCSVGQADLKEELATVVDDWGWKGTIDELLAYWFTTGSMLNQEVVDYVQTLRAEGIRCFIATDQEKYRGEYLRGVLGNGKVAEEVFFSAEVGSWKKEEVFWETSLEKIHPSLSKDEILFVDDDAHKVEAVAGFGIDSHLFTNLNELKQFLT